MITFKLVPKTMEILVGDGAAVVGSVTRKDSNGPVYVPKKLVPLRALDMIRILRHMGVTGFDVKLEAKIETAEAAQQVVLSQARALRFGKKTAPAPKRSHKKKVT